VEESATQESPAETSIIELRIVVLSVLAMLLGSNIDELFRILGPGAIHTLDYLVF